MDKGWAWVVLFSCFVAFFLSGWFAYTVGVMHVALLDVYEDDVAKTSWVGALHSSMMCLTGPVAGMIISHYNCRICTLIGAFLILLGFTISAFVKGINALLLTYGFIAGAGTGLCYCPAVVSLSYNFKKYLGITAGVSMTGAALGIFSGGPVIRYFLDNYGLSGAFLLMGAVGANMCVCAMLFRPTKFEKDLKRKRAEETKQSLTFKETLKDVWQRYTEILQNRAFSFHSASIFSWNLAQSAIYLHLPFYAESKGTSPEAAAALFTGMGVFSLIARVLTGLVVTKREIDGLILHLGSLGMAAISTLMFPLYSATYVGQMIYSCLIGFYFGSPIVLLNPLTVEIVGLDHLATAFGLETFVLGSGYLVGPPLVGFIVDHGASYNVSFFVSGGFLLVSSLLTLGTAFFHDKTSLPVDPALLSSRTIIPPEVASTISLRAKELHMGNTSYRPNNENREKAEIVDDLEAFIGVLDAEHSRFLCKNDVIKTDYAKHQENIQNQPSESDALYDVTRIEDSHNIPVESG